MNNSRIFNYANDFQVKNRFKNNSRTIKVYNNSNLLLGGVIELIGVTDNSFECILSSNLAQLVDDLKDIDLQDMTNMPIIEAFDFETTIAAHINANYKDSDEADYQFPLTFYNTYFTPYNVYSGLTDQLSYPMGAAAFSDDGDRPQQNYYYLLNKTTVGSNEFYYNQLPLSFYLKTVMTKMLENVGWSMSGSFWDNASVKKIIMPYVGDNDVYDKALVCSNGVEVTSGGTCTGGQLNLDTSKFLPKKKCLEFMKDVINTFNLYFTIDVNQKQINFETYDTIFGNKSLGYDITNKFITSPKKYKIDKSNPSISFSKTDNDRIMGDNYYISGSTTSASNVNYISTTNSYYDSIYNHIGTTGEIKINFNCPNIKRMYLRNYNNYGVYQTDALDYIIFLPNISTQTPQDNNGVKFNKNTGETTINNTNDRTKFKGGLSLMYYYGISDSDYVQHTGKASQDEYFYINFDGGKLKIPFASPYAYNSYRDRINSILDDSAADPKESIYASYLQSINLMIGGGTKGNTDFSLFFGDGNNLSPTLYDYFHFNKYNRMQNGETLVGEVKINDYDWIRMKINQPLLYKGYYYSLVSLTDYDVVSGLAKIIMIKQI